MYSIKIAPNIVFSLPNGLSSNRFRISNFKIPTSAQRSLWKIAEKHIWIHYGLHLSACLVRDIINKNSYPLYSPIRWRDSHMRVSISCKRCDGRGYSIENTPEGKAVKIICKTCGGSGKIEISVERCKYCHGTGRVSSVEYATGKQIQVQCPECKGTGEEPTHFSIPS